MEFSCAPIRVDVDICVGLNSNLIEGGNCEQKRRSASRSLGSAGSYPSRTAQNPNKSDSTENKDSENEDCLHAELLPIILMRQFPRAQSRR